MTFKLLTEQHLQFLSLKGGCTGSSESTLVKVPHCWKSHVPAQLSFAAFNSNFMDLFVFQRAIVSLHLFWSNLLPEAETHGT